MIQLVNDGVKILSWFPGTEGHGVIVRNYFLPALCKINHLPGFCPEGKIYDGSVMLTSTFWEIPPRFSYYQAKQSLLCSSIFSPCKWGENNNFFLVKTLGEKCYLNTKHYSGKKDYRRLLCVKCQFLAVFNRCTNRTETARGEQSTKTFWTAWVVETGQSLSGLLERMLVVAVNMWR
jgi:hypothetical protein